MTFWNFWKLKSKFCYHLKSIFLNNYQYSWSYFIFLLKLRHNITVIWGVSLQHHYTRQIVCCVAIEKEVKLFFLFNISTFCELIYEWFFMRYKTKVRCKLCHQLILKLSKFRGTVFAFSNFWNFWKLKNRFCYHLKPIVLNSFQITLPFVKTLSQYKINLKRLIAISLYQAYRLLCIYSYIMFYSQKMRGLSVIWAWKSLISRDKIMILSEICP